MLVCPHCQFENPDTNKFCQQCGTSLTEKFCPQCGAKVAVSAQACDTCGTVTGQVWLAVVSPIPDRENRQMEAPSQLPLAELEQNQGIFGGVASTEDSATPMSDILNTEVITKIQPPEAFPSGSDLSAEELSNMAIEDTASLNLPAASSFSVSDNPSYLDKLEAIAVPARDFLKETESEAEPPQPLPESVGRETPTSQSPSQPLLPEGAFLDTQQRYQLLEPLVVRDSVGNRVARVLDRQPLQVSLLQALLTHQSQTPAIAQPYLSLQAQFPRNLPVVHEVWQDAQTVVLLEDGTQLSLLSERWSDLQVSEQQILYWLYEMTELWSALGSWHCYQSLLDLNNLRVSSDPNYPLASIRLLCLQSDSPDALFKLSHLGQLWQTLFDRSQRTLFSATTVLLHDLNQGGIQTIDELRSRLDTMQMELEPEFISTSASPPLQLGKVSQRIMDAADTTTLPLPMQVYRLEDCGCTDKGRQRDHNEDFYGIWTQTHKLETSIGRILQTKGLYILCDGMGGHSSGEVASQLAVETLKQYFQSHWGNELPSEATIQEAILLANQALYEINQKDARSGSGRMGTTLVMLLIQDAKAAVAHVGDSRLYCLRRGRSIAKITNDHEVGQREIDRGIDREIAYARPDAYQLTQALGPRDTNFVKPDVQFFEIDEDMLIVLASDGLTDNNLLETHWEKELKPLLEPQADLEEGLKRLMNLGNELNGHDNITTILIRALVGPSRL